MAIWISSVYIQKNEAVTLIENYHPVIDDVTWKELNTYAKELDLDCLKYIYFAGDCIFNCWQCKEILEKEIPLLRAQNLSVNSIAVVDGLEHAIKDTYSKSFHAYLLFEGD